MKTPTELSPQQLCQELVREHPWRVLAVCLMLNQTTGVQVRRVFPEFFRRWPGPLDLLAADEAEVKALIRPLGFQNRRYERLCRMSAEFLACLPVRWIHGVGKYALDSYRMFALGELVEDVEDKELRKYVLWAKGLGSGLPSSEEALSHGPARREGADRDHDGPGGVQLGP